MTVGTSSRRSHLRSGLEEREGSKRLRELRHFVPLPGVPFVTEGDRRLLNFSSNDYLGLATDPDVIEASAEAARRYGVGAGASRLVTGGYHLHRELERDLADFTARPTALLFNSGFQANATVIPALSKGASLVVCDREAHASILHGCQVGRGRFRRFRHNDPDDLDRILGGLDPDPARPPVIVTESLFSMSGDRAPLQEICRVADRHDAILMVDDAHAMGVYGEGGRGLAAPHSRIDVVLGTFGKAFGASGAFVACDDLLRSHLVNFCSGFIYTTAPPPPVLGAVRASLAKIRSGSLDQGALLERVEHAHRRLREAGFDTSPSDTHVIPIPLRDDAATVACARHLEEAGILAVPIRPPTVPEGTARIRISLTRLHTAEHVESLVGALLTFPGRE